MSPRTKVQIEHDLRPVTPDEMIASIEAAAAFLAETHNEALRRRAELDRRIKVARSARLSLRRIATAAGMSHTQIQRIGEQ